MTIFTLIALFLMPALAQDAFDRFTFCRENNGGEYQEQCFDLDANGRGVFRFVPREDDPVEVEFAFSPRVRERFLELIEDSEYLEEARQYESGRNVANLGTKTMVLEGPFGVREAEFNYTTIREASELSTFFERLIQQEMLLFDVGIALQFDRLGIPERLDRIESELRSDRLPDHGRVGAVLDRIADDERLVNYARTTAARLRDSLEDPD
jgi:hypothetical protein